MRKKTQDDFVQDVKDLYGSEYTVLGTYLGTHKKVKVKHNVCGKEFEITPSSLLSGKGCRDCGYKRNGDNRRYTQAEFEKKLFEKYGNEYQVVGKYINSQTKIKVKHLTCGRILNMLPASLLHGNGCTHCKHREGRLISNDDFKKHLKEVVGDEYIPLTEYTGATDKVLFKHLACGNVFEMRPNNIFNGQRCPVCSNILNAQRRTIPFSTIKTRFEEEPDYQLVTTSEDYHNTRTPVKIKHKSCGSIFKMTPDCFFRGERCPHCQHLGQSKGELRIGDFLDSYSLAYKYGYIIPDLVDKDHLHFDFYLPRYRVAIEYDGEQHFNKNKPYYSETLIAHDRMKDQYCQENQINLIRIKYNQDVNIVLHNRLKPILNKHNPIL